MTAAALICSSPAGPQQMDAATLSPYFVAQHVDCGVGAEAGELGRGRQLRPARAHLEHAELGRAAGELHAAQAQLRERARGRAAGVGLLDAAGERALAAHREPVTVRHRRAGEDAGGDHEDVVPGRAGRPAVDLLSTMAEVSPWPPSATDAGSPEAPWSRRPCVRSTVRKSVTVAHILSRGRSARPRSPFRRPAVTMK